MTTNYVIPMDFAIINAPLPMALRQTVPKINFASPMEYAEPLVHQPTVHKEIVLMVICAYQMVIAILVRIILNIILNNCEAFYSYIETIRSFYIGLSIK